MLSSRRHFVRYWPPKHKLLERCLVSRTFGVSRVNTSKSNEGYTIERSGTYCPQIFCLVIHFIIGIQAPLQRKFIWVWTSPRLLRSRPFVCFLELSTPNHVLHSHHSTEIMWLCKKFFENGQWTFVLNPSAHSTLNHQTHGAVATHDLHNVTSFSFLLSYVIMIHDMSIAVAKS